MNRMAQWISLATVLASFLVGMAVANAQQYYGPASGPQAMPPFGAMQPMMPPVTPYGPTTPMMSPYPGMQTSFQQAAAMQASGMTLAELQPPAPLEYPNDVSPAGTYTGGKGKSGKAAKGGCGCGRDWTVGAAIIYMKRDKPDALTLLNAPPGMPALDASDFDFDFEQGYEFNLTRHMSNGLALEGRYMQIDGWNANNTFNVPPGSFTIATNPVTLLSSGSGDTAVSQYTSRFKSAEINAWQRIHEWARIGAGVRWIGFYDKLDSNIAGSTFPDALLQSNSRNNMYGFQMVGDGTLWNNGRRFSLNVTGRAGIFASDSSQSVLLQEPAGVINNSVTRSGWAPAFAGEVGLFGIFDLTDRIAVRAGYQAMWLEGISLASDQIDNTTNLVAPPVQATRDTGGGIFAHGGILTLEVSL